MSTRLVKNTFLYVFIGFLPVAANFFLAPLYTRYMLPEQYALVGMATLFQAFLTFFMSLSLDSAFSRFYFNYEKKKILNSALLSTLLLTVMMISAFIYLLLYLLGDSFFTQLFSNPDFRFSNYGHWVILTTFCTVIYLFFIINYRNADNIRGFIFINLLFFFVPVAGTLLALIFFKSGALGAVIGRAAGSALVILPILAWFFARNKIVFRKKLLRPAFKYALPVVPYQLFFAGFLYLDRIFLLHYFNPREFGVYNFAALLSSVVPVFLNAVSNATNPTIYRELANKDNYEKVRSYNFMILFACVLFVCLCIAGVVPALRLVINVEYAASYPYTGLLFLSYIPYIHYLLYALPLFYSGKTKFFPWVAVASLLAGIIFNLALIHLLGIWAVCLSLFVIRATQMITAWLFDRQLGFTRLTYVEQDRPVIASGIIIAVYCALFFINLRLQLLPIDIINLVPLVVFLIIVPFLYHREKAAVLKLYKDFIAKIRFKQTSNT
ncbi:oligosaccharide flippase family protein [Nostoc ellipsosporum NOK]|nr:oligosaccharide flippase family protein [Nostoc ellipsosporum NOK]